MVIGITIIFSFHEFTFNAKKCLYVGDNDYDEDRETSTLSKILKQWLDGFKFFCLWWLSYPKPRQSVALYSNRTRRIKMPVSAILGVVPSLYTSTNLILPITFKCNSVSFRIFWCCSDYTQWLSGINLNEIHLCIPYH